MPAITDQLHFAADFVLFLAAAAGVAFVALGAALASSPARVRLALGAGLALVGASAILDGSNLLTGDSPLLFVVRAAGVALGVAGSTAWGVGWTARGLLWLGLGAVAVVALAGVASSPSPASVAAALAGVAIAGAVVTASRRSIAARIAASAAVSLLILMLFLGVALSAVLVSTVQDGAVERLEGRARTAAAAATSSYTPRLNDAGVVAGSLRGDRIDELRRQAEARRSSSALNDELAVLSRGFLGDVALAYVTRSGSVLGSVPGAARLDNATVLALPRADVVTQAVDRGAPRGSVVVLGGRPLAVGAQPVLDTNNRTVLGVAVAVSPLDRTSLAVATTDDPGLSLAIAGRDGMLVANGRQPAFAGVRGFVRQAIEEGRRRSAVVGDRFVAVAPVEAADGRPVLAMVASTPTTVVNQTRDALFRNLFVIALVGTLVALGLAAGVGRGIGARLRRLTDAASSIQRGNLDARTEMSGDDEVGVLGSTFDAMATSVQQTTAAESALRERLEAVVGGMGEALVALDAAGRVTDFNRAAEQLIGVRSPAALGRPLNEVVAVLAGDGTPVLDGDRRAARSSGSEGWVERADGTRVPVAVSVGTIAASGGVAGGSVLVLRDLRREREVEQMKTDFLSRVGHELRTPLTPIMGYAKMLRAKRVPPADAAGMYDEMLSQSEHLLRIIGMLEFFARAGAGRVDVASERVDPAVLVDQAVKRWRIRAGRPRALRRRVEGVVPQVLGDGQLLAASLDELIDNAFKFAPGGGTIVVGARGEGRYVELFVVDKGKGLSEEEKARVFAPFAQGDPSDTRRFGGLGLGLAFVQRVAEAHGGELRCDSVEGEGAKFSIVVPVVPKETAS